MVSMEWFLIGRSGENRGFRPHELLEAAMATEMNLPDFVEQVSNVEFELAN